MVTITVVPDEIYFIWQLDLFLEGKTNTHVLVYCKTPNPSELMKKLEAKYPEVLFFYYHDSTGMLLQHIRDADYIPLLRLYCLWRHFELHPELKDKPIWYIDSDVLYTKELDLSKFLTDDINYLSNTVSYIGYNYLMSKEKDVLPDKLEKYKLNKPVTFLLKALEIDEELVKENDQHSGGAQYLLKNIDYLFWRNCYYDTISIRKYFRQINQRYFESEDKGFQSWCADMWALLWNLWKRGSETRCPEELNFAWATDPIIKLKSCVLYHNAGADGSNPKVFYKGKYANNLLTPWQDLGYLTTISPEFCSYFYVNRILNLQDPVCK